MKSRFAIPAFLFFLSVGLFLISNPIILLGLLGFFHLAGAWEKRVGTISQILAAYAILLLIFGAFSTVFSSRVFGYLSQTWQNIKNAPRAFRNASSSIVQYHADLGSNIVWLFLAAGIGVVVRGYFLSQPIRGDEAFTFLNFANQDFSSLFDYQVPNNHVFHTLLVKISTLLWGASPASIRFPVFLAGILSIFFVFYLSRSINGAKNSGVFAALAVAVFPYLILYSTNARGYSIITLLSLIIAFVGFQYASNPSTPGMILLSILSAFGMLTIPTMAMPIAGIFCWIICLLFVNKYSLKAIIGDFAIPFSVLTGILTLILYTPVILVSNGLDAIVSNKFVQSQSWSEFFAQFIPQTGETFYELCRDIPTVALAVIFILVIIGLYRLAKNGNWSALLILPTFFFGSAVVLLIQHTAPYPRTWIFIIPFILLVCDSGLSYILQLIPRRIQPLINTVLFMAGFLFAGYLMSANIITKYPDTSAFPEAPIAVEYLKPILKSDDVIRMTNTADWPVHFYFWYAGAPIPNQDKSDATGRVFFIIKKSRYSIQDMTEKPVIKLLEMDNLAIYEQIGLLHPYHR